MRNSLATSSVRSSVLDEGVYDIAELEEKALKPAQWVAAAGGIYRTVSVSHPQLPSGVYDITQDNRDGSPIFIKKDIKTDELISIPNGVAEHTLQEIEKFWNSKELFAEKKVLHRRGYILYGAQGTGKSSILNLITQGVIARKGVVFICSNPAYFRIALAVFRSVEPTRHLICIFEDIDAIIKKHGEDELLGILDGTNQIDGVLNIATTNYPELLDKRLIARPRRFDRAIKIDVPSAPERRAFFARKLEKEAQINEFTDATEGLSFASLAEIFIAVECLGYTLQDAVAILRDLETRNFKNEAESKVGFDVPNKPHE